MLLYNKNLIREVIYLTKYQCFVYTINSQKKKIYKTFIINKIYIQQLIIVEKYRIHKYSAQHPHLIHKSHHKYSLLNYIKKIMNL